MDIFPASKQNQTGARGGITETEKLVLRSGSGLFYRLLEGYPGGIVLLGGDIMSSPQLLYTSPKFEAITGIAKDALSERGLEALCGLASGKGIRDHFVKAVELKTAVRQEVQLLCGGKPGCWVVVELYCEDREEELWVLKVEDISARKAREDALGWDMERFSKALSMLGEAVILLGKRQEIDFVNREGERLIGQKLSMLSRRTFSETIQFVSWRDRQPVVCPVTRVFRSGKRVGPINDLLLVSKDGTERRVSCQCSPILDERERLVGAAVVLRDISSYSLEEEELRKVQRMESIALLADGVAHDFNNILTGILGNLSLARSCSEEGSRVAGILTAAEKAASRAKDLTHRLAQFSRGGTSVTSTVSLKDLARECAGFILSGSNCRGRTEIADNLWVVEVDEGQISQVLNNLLINAIQAMPDGGTITVAAGNVELGEGGAILLAPGAYVRLSVRDEGKGIQPEDLPRIFDPYFTTKQKGTGLGLATSYSIIKAHQGYITVDSEVGRGTVFTIYLPALPASTAPGGNQEEMHLYHGKGRLLVMDDEVMIQQITGDMLTHLGYEVNFARDGMEALACYRRAVREGAPFQAVLLDLTVPGGLGGKETIELLRAEFPDVCAIISSGYSANPIVRDYQSHGFCGAINKPYTIHELSRAVSEALALNQG